jgi:hypothetical protein
MGHQRQIVAKKLDISGVECRRIHAQIGIIGSRLELLGSKDEIDERDSAFVISTLVDHKERGERAVLRSLAGLSANKAS